MERQATISQVLSSSSSSSSASTIQVCWTRPGEKNLATMIDNNGNIQVFHKEKRAAGMEALKEKLSRYSGRTNVRDAFFACLQAKKEFDSSKAGQFYEEFVWRNWNFLCKKK